MWKWAKNFRLYLILSFVISLIVVKVAYLDASFRNIIALEGWISHTNEVITELDLVLSSAKDAETGARGFLLTNSEAYLEPYQIGVAGTHSHVSTLKELTKDNPTQQAALKQIELLLEKRISALEGLIRDFRTHQGKVDRTSIFFAEGKALMDELRDQIDTMKGRENDLLRERSKTADASKSRYAWILYLFNAFIISVMILTFVQIGRSQSRTSRDNEEKDLVSRLANLMTGNLDANQAGEKVLEFLSKEFDLIAGKIFVLDKNQLLEVASLGTSHNPHLQPLENSLFRSALQRKTLWQIEDIPADYWHISSSLGGRTPKALLLAPLRFQGDPIGILEIGSFQNLSVRSQELLSLLCETIAIGMSTAQSKSNLQALLEKTQQQSEELQAQQEELKASNEELEQQTRALENQQQALNMNNTELRNMQAALEQRAEDLQRSTQYKSEFLAKMSHELRTPLNGLLILSTLLIENKEKNLNQQQLQFARSIHGAGNDLLTLINDILDLSKIEARKLTLRADDFTLNELFHSLKTTFAPQASAKSLSFQTRLDSDLEAVRLHTDRQRLEQVLRNFIANSLKFTEHGSISVSADLLASGSSVRINVADTGVGVPQNKQQLIFEAFEQADGSVSRKYGGTGLGLTISRELASLLGGSISLHSEEGKGSTFSITFPIRLAEKAAEQQPLVTGKKSHDDDTALTVPRNSTASRMGGTIDSLVQIALKDIENNGKTLLVVEDDTAFRRSVVDAAKSYGFHPIETDDGEVALGILNMHTPAAILLDIKLPGISGLGILEMVKKMPHLRHVPVHMISALDYHQNALRMGALGYLTKPVTIEKVRSALERIEKLISSNIKRVLIIEDDERQSMAVANLIDGNDIEVVTAKTGERAIQALSTDAFDCIILDLTLPDISGFELLKKLTKLEISLPPIVIYTGKDLTQDEDRYLRQFSESIIIKGARSPERLLDEVNLFLHRVESLLPQPTRDMLATLRSQEKAFEGKSVLVVDDDIRNIFALTSALETKGLKVEVARDGIEALEAVEKKPELSLVLMDIMMPKMDGFEAIRRIRENPDSRIKHIPIVALTAKAMREDHEKCIEAGANDYLPKPINLENLMTILKVWLSPKGLFLS